MMRVSVKIPVICDKCGASRLYYPSKVPTLAGTTCARCRRSPKIALTCPSCGKTRAVWPSAARKLASNLCTHCAGPARAKRSFDPGLARGPA